jgi:hypothetical protein
MLSMHRGFGAFTLATLRLMRRYRRIARTLPLIDAYPAAFGGRVGYFEDWITHPEPDDPYWVPRRATVSPELIPPTSLLTGWSDVCLDQTLGLYPTDARRGAGGAPGRRAVDAHVGLQ